MLSSTVTLLMHLALHMLRTSMVHVVWWWTISPITLNVSKADGWPIAFLRFRISTLQTTLWSGAYCSFTTLISKYWISNITWGLPLVMICLHVYRLVQNNESLFDTGKDPSRRLSQAVSSREGHIKVRISYNASPNENSHTNSHHHRQITHGSGGPVLNSKFYIAQSVRSWHSKRRLYNQSSNFLFLYLQTPISAPHRKSLNFVCLWWEGS